MRDLLYRILYWLCMKFTGKAEMVTITRDSSNRPVLPDDVAGKFRVFTVQFEKPISLRKLMMLHDAAELPAAKYQTDDELWWRDEIKIGG